MEILLIPSLILAATIASAVLVNRRRTTPNPHNPTPGQTGPERFGADERIEPDLPMPSTLLNVGNSARDTRHR